LRHPPKRLRDSTNNQGTSAPRTPRRVSIIFLDIDGVLINRQSLLSCEYLERADKPCVDALNRIVASTGALIVVSSDWRQGRTVAELQGILAEWGVKATVVGTTPVPGEWLVSTSRGDEIEAWMNTFGRESIASFVIPDDNADMNGLSPFLVKTEFEPGLTESDADHAIKILKSADRMARVLRHT
jgi:hypothetical protein